jgi:hypothetical protein
MISIGGGVGFLAGKVGYQVGVALSENVIILWAVLFIPAFFLVVGFHEAGHALAGILVKFDFRMYVVGPFMWEKGEASWKFKWNKNVNTAGGVVLCMPTGSENLKNRFSIYAGGGPIASLVLAGLSYLIYYVLSPFVIGYLFLLIVFLSLVIFLVTIIPLHMGGFTSDGGRVLNLQRGGDKARFELLILKIISSSAGGLRPSLLNTTELEEALTLAKKLQAPFGVYLHSYFHQAAWDLGDLEAAEKHLSNYVSEIESIPAGIKNAVWLDAAFFFALAKKDIARADYYWNQFTPSAIIPKAQIFATEAAMLSLKNQREDSIIKLESSIKEMPNILDRGIGVALLEKMNSLKVHLN